MSRIRTLRGKATDATIKHLVIDDGNLNHAFKVLEFVVFSDLPASAAADAWGTLAVNEDGASNWDASNNGQIGWSGQSIHNADGPMNQFSLIDPDHVIVRDLYLYGEAGGSTQTFNYFVRLQAVSLNDDESIIALIKEGNQDV